MLHNESREKDGINMCNVHFRTMTESDYQMWKQASIEDYAYHLWEAKQATSMEEARARASQEFDDILTAGIATPQVYLKCIDDLKANQVGFIWYELRTDGRCFIADFGIEESERRKGYGLSALKVLEECLKTEPIDRIVLHVFTSNQAARRLYEKAGFVYAEVKGAQEGSLYMYKQIKD